MEIFINLPAVPFVPTEEHLRHPGLVTDMVTSHEEINQINPCGKKPGTNQISTGRGMLFRLLGI
jgi:hypothetical protein